MSQTNQLPISSPLSLGDLLDRAFRLYRARFGMLLLTAALFLIPLGILSGLFTGNFMIGYIDLLENINLDPSTPPDAVFDELFTPLFGFIGSIALFSIIWILVNGLVALALTSQVISILHQEKQTLGQGLRIAWRRFWTYLLMNILRFLSIFAVSIGVIIAILVVGGIIAFIGAMALGMSTNFLESSNPMSDASAIGFFILICCGYLLAIIAMIVPALYFNARWIIATPGIVEKKWKASEALRESWRMTQGYVWRSVGYFVLLYLLNMVMIGLPQSIFQQLLLLLLPPESTELTVAISAALGSLFNVVWQPFYIAAVVLLYYDLRVRKESYDLELQLQQLESEVEQPQL